MSIQLPAIRLSFKSKSMRRLPELKHPFKYPEVWERVTEAAINRVEFMVCEDKPKDVQETDIDLAIRMAQAKGNNSVTIIDEGIYDLSTIGIRTKNELYYQKLRDNGFFVREARVSEKERLKHGILFDVEIRILWLRDVVI